MQPEGDALERSLTFWRETGSGDDTRIAEFPEEELKAIAKSYGEDPPPAAAHRYSYRGKFTGQTPQDLGGAGGYTRWPTDMGTLFLYTERFRGNDDLARSLDTRRESARELAALLLGWFRAEIGDDPDFGKVETFFQQHFEHDLENLAVYCWTAAAVAASAFDAEEQSETMKQELLVRVGRYFVERGYVTPADLPELVRMAEQEDAGRMLEFVRTLLSKKMGWDEEETARRLKFLTDPQTAGDSLGAYAAGTEGFRLHLEQWRLEHVDNPDATPPEPLQYVGELAVGLTGFDLNPNDQLRVTLDCPAAPYATNGTWDETAKTVAWSAEINAVEERPAPVVPVLLFAAWSVPESEFQRKHFGKVVLEGERLGEYCLWRAALTKPEAREWDAFLAGLSPQVDLAAKVEAFRFTSDPPVDPATDDKPKSLADKPRELIQAGL